MLIYFFFFPFLSLESFSEDEWNLLYVAVTRAKKRLIMTRSLENILTLAGVSTDSCLLTPGL